MEKSKNFKKKLDQLETKQSELSRKLEEKTSTEIINKVSNSLSISGLLEVEVVGIDNIQPSYDASDIRLATAELSLDSKINKNTSGHVLLLWEEGDHSVNVDEGYIVLQSPTGLSLKAGKLYIPFGNFETHFISDPLTLELGETNQSSLVLTYAKNMIELSVGAFNGSTYKEGDINIDDLVASLTVSPSKDFSIGVSYLSNLAETDARTTYPFMYYAWPNWLVKEVPAISGFANITMGPVNFLIEYL